MDRLRAMRVFSAIAAAGSLSAAARRLGMPLTNVSRTLAALEAGLGAPLVVRTTRSLALTESGTEYLDACRSILEHVDDAEARLSGKGETPRGELAISAPVAFGRLHVLPVVTAYLQAFPSMSVRMLLLDRNVDLIEEGIDVAVRIGELVDSQLMARAAGSVRQIVCAAPAYLKAHGRPRLPADLATHRCITFLGFGSGQDWTFAGPKKPDRVRLKVCLSVNTADTAIDAAIAGLGITRVLSYQAERAIAAGQLVRVLGTYEGAVVPVSILHREGRIQQSKVREFVRLAADMLPPRLAERRPSRTSRRR